MIRCHKEYKDLLEKIFKVGLDVNDTFEITGEKVDVMLADTDTIKDIFKVSDEFEHEFLESICKFNNKTIGPYITEKYFNLVPSLKVASEQFKKDCIETRRAVITFPKEHCFQSIQFLFRDNTINIVCYMRSCDAIKNLPYDVWLCHKLADMLSYYLTDLLGVHPYKRHKLTMMFGSLHAYKEDVEHVF